MSGHQPELNPVSCPVCGRGFLAVEPCKVHVAGVHGVSLADADPDEWDDYLAAHADESDE